MIHNFYDSLYLAGMVVSENIKNSTTFLFSDIKQRTFCSLFYVIVGMIIHVYMLL